MPQQCVRRFLHPRNPTLALALAKLETETAHMQLPCARKVKGQVASSVAEQQAITLYPSMTRPRPVQYPISNNLHRCLADTVQANVQAVCKFLSESSMR
jgi:hypothetical protein